jgi:nitrite reductase/ring-hydroxylating ferredoxin subunit
VDAATRLGLPAAYTTTTDLPYTVAAAVRFDEQAQLHPRQYCLGLAAALDDLGGRIYEQTRVTNVKAGSPCRVVTKDDAEITAPWVVLATHVPILDRGAFFAKTWPSRSYAMALELRDNAQAPKGMHLSADTPTRSARSAMDDSLTIVGGEGHKVGQDDDTRRRYAALDQWAKQAFDVKRVVNRWSAQDNMPVDGTPFVGRQLPRSPILVATGFRKWGMTNGTAAAIVLASIIDGRPSDWLVAYDATRTRGPLTSKTLYAENVDAVAGHLIGDRMRTLRPADASTLQPGEGGIVEFDGHKVAAFRDDNGHLSAVSPICKHVGCLVSFNRAEHTWDCPCHGSRYTTDGQVIQGPSTSDLKRHPPTQSEH